MHIIFTFNELTALSQAATSLSLSPLPLSAISLHLSQSGSAGHRQVHLMLQVFCSQVWRIRPPATDQLEIQFFS